MILGCSPGLIVVLKKSKNVWNFRKNSLSLCIEIFNGMGSIYKNVNADAKRIHPRSNGIPVSYVEAGMRPGDTVRIDLDEMESLIAWHDERALCSEAGYPDVVYSWI